MKRTHLPLNGMRVFDAAARHLSFTRAADELAVTPAAVGQQIRALEDTLGVVLFRRTTRGLELTPEVWVTTIELADAPDRSTDVAITLTHEPLSGGLLERRRQRKTVRKVAEDTIESELGKVADHVHQAEASSKEAPA